MLTLLCAVAGIAWGGETTITFTPGTDTGTTSVTKNDVTATMTSMNNSDYYQIYANQSGTFSCSKGNITKIEFTCTASGNSKYGPGNASANVGSYSYSGNIGTWTGSAETVTISSTAQVRMSSLTITVDDTPILWSEDFSSNSLEGYTVVDGGSETKLYNQNYAGGTAPELLIGKNTGSFSVSIDLGNYSGGMTLTFKSNRNDAIVVTATGGQLGTEAISGSGPYVYTYPITVPNGTSSLTLTFQNAINSNVRVDDFELKMASTTGETYNLFSGNLVEGDYVITGYTSSSYKAMSSDVESGAFTGKDVSGSGNSDIITADNTIVWHIAPAETEGYWILKNGNNYAASNGNNVEMANDASGDNAQWSVSGSYIFTNKAGKTLNFNQGKFDCYETRTSTLSLYRKPVQVVTPAFSPAGGTFTGAQDVSITCETSGVSIYYTTDGSEPTSSSTLYTGPISIDETTTVKAIAIIADDKSDVAEAAFTIIDPSSLNYDLDFEKDASTYTNWVFTNIISNYNDSGVTAHGGSNYGSTGGKASGSIQTKYTIATPQSLTCYVSKQSTNTSVSTWYIQVSSDGSSWTNVASISASSMSKGEWKEFTADLSAYTNVYVRVYYDGTTAVRLIDDISLKTVKAPVISPEGGEFVNSQLVTITADEGCTIYYTKDGSDPTTESTQYAQPFNLYNTATVKAIAVKDGQSSDVASAVFTILPTKISLIGNNNPLIFNNLIGFASDDYATYNSIVLTEKHGSSYAGWKAENVKSAQDVGLQLKAGEGKITIPAIYVSARARVEVAVKKGKVKVKEAYSSEVPNSSTSNNTIDGQTSQPSGSSPFYFTIECSGNEDAIISCIIIYAIGGGSSDNPGLNISGVNLKVGKSKTLEVSTDSPGDIVFNTMSYDVAEITENVDETGHKTYTVVGKAPGTANFMASLYPYDHDDAQYAGAMTWFNVTVEENTPKNYSLFTGELVEGDYVIYYDGKAMKNTVSSDRLQYKEVEPVDNVITTDDETIVWHIAKSGEYWTIQSLDNDKYAAATGSNNQATVIDKGTDDKALWIVEGKYDFQNKSNSRYLRNNGTYGFACYASGTGGALSLYKYVEPFTFTIQEAATDGTDYYATIADLGEGYFKVPKGLEIYAVSVENNKLIPTRIYSEAIPGNGAYLVKSAVAGQYTFYATPSPEIEVTLGDNMLVSTGESGVTEAEMAHAYPESGYKFYKLALNKKTRKVGFLWGAENGAAFTYTKGHQAYLPVLTSSTGSSVSAFYFDDTTDVTGISDVQAEAVTTNDVYTLSGVRVSGTALPKGIYIVNGNKVVIK